jgi:hypothetical protein
MLYPKLTPFYFTDGVKWILYDYPINWRVIRCYDTTAYAQTFILAEEEIR